MNYAERIIPDPRRTRVPRRAIHAPSEYHLHDDLEAEIIRRGGRFARRAVERHRADVPPDSTVPWPGVTMRLATCLCGHGFPNFALEAVRAVGAGRGLDADDVDVAVNRVYRNELHAYVRGDVVPGVATVGVLVGTGADGRVTRVPFGPDAVTAAMAFYDRPSAATHLGVHDEQSILMAHAHGLRRRRG